MVENVFDEDSFQQPKKYIDSHCNAMLILYGLMGRKNSRFNDDIVFDITRYKFHDLVESKNKIENELRDYCLKQIPNIYVNKIDVTVDEVKRNVRLLINITDTNTDQDEIIQYSVKNNNNKLKIDLI